jgi:excinuclease ABC subunit C
MFRDAHRKILYIGRATFLRKRVSQYFRADIDQRISEMVSQARFITHQETANVLEAVVLEANLIKKYLPKYNIKDKDHRSFLYVVIPKKIAYSRPLIVRERELKKFPPDSAHIFGPYQSWYVLRQLLKIIRKVFPYSTCKPLSGKPCFDYQIGDCPGTCLGLITPKDYQKNIHHIVLYLSGQHTRLIASLKKSNPQLVRAFQHLQDVTLLGRDDLSMTFAAHRIEGYDISHLTGRETVGAMVVFIGGEPDTSQYRLFNIKEAPAADDLRALEEVLTRRFNHTEWPMPDLLMIDGGKPQIDFLHRLLKKRNIEIPMIGLSKLGGDHLVYPPGTKKVIRDLGAGLMQTLQQVRDEAHRFGRRASRRQRGARR